MKLSFLVRGVILNCLVIFLFACQLSGSEDNDSDTATTKRLDIVETDFDVAVDNIEASHIEEKINNESDFYNKPPETDGEEFGSCLSQVASNYRFSLIEGEYYELAFSDVNAEACQELLSSNYFNYQDILFSGYFLLQGVDGANNVANLAGTNLVDLAQAGNIFPKIFSQQEITIQLTIPDSPGVSGESRSIYFNSAESNAGEPCLADADENTWVRDNCVFRYLNTRTFTQNGQVIETLSSKSLLSFRGIKISRDGTYYTGGTIDFTFGNWTGTMTYDDTDSAVPPTYSATNGQQTITGTLGDSSDKSL